MLSKHCLHAGKDRLKVNFTFKEEEQLVFSKIFDYTVLNYHNFFVCYSNVHNLRFVLIIGPLFCRKKKTINPLKKKEKKLSSLLQIFFFLRGVI